MIIDRGDTIINANNIGVISKGVEMVNTPVSTKYEWKYYIKIDNIRLDFAHEAERDYYFDTLKEAMKK